MLGQLGHVMVGLADSIMVGQVGTVPLAASSFAHALFYFPLTFGIGISYGITPHVAEHHGEKDDLKIIEYLKHGFAVCMATGVLLFFLVKLLAVYMHQMNQPQEVVFQARPYLIILGSSIIPLMMFQAFRQFAEGLSYTKMVMIVSVGSNLLNVLLNYILIFGKMGFEPMGLMGAGYATLISRIVMGLWMMGYIVFSKPFKPYLRLLQSGTWHGRFITNILNIGVPAGLQFIFEVGAFGFAAIMVGWISAPALAAHQIVISLASLTYMAASGLAASATIRVGNQLGRKDIKTLRQVGKVSFVMVIFFMTAGALILFLGRFQLPALFVQDPVVIGIASSLLVIAALFQLSDGIQVVGLGALRGMKDVKIPTVFTFMAYWIIGLPLSFVLAFTLRMETTGIWIGLLVGLTVSAFLNGIRFNHLSKKLLVHEG
jgi:MATE family multidrug resistance protein